MNNSHQTIAQQIAAAASAFEQRLTGRVPRSVTVVLSGTALRLAGSEAQASTSKFW